MLGEMFQTGAQTILCMKRFKLQLQVVQILKDSHIFFHQPQSWMWKETSFDLEYQEKVPEG